MKLKLTGAKRSLELNATAIMGIVNCTPDSFFDGGSLATPSQACRHAELLIAEGADIIDIGGESTRPGATPISVEIELERVIPVIEALRQRSNVPISIDTSKPEVMKAAAEAGADFINDVCALQQPEALKIASELGLPVCLMHMRGTPATMQEGKTEYPDVVVEVTNFFLDRIAACEAVGIARERIVLDPGFGFGKNLDANYRLLAQLEQLNALGFPVLVGVSRKSMIGAVLNQVPASDRLIGSIAAACFAALKGAAILRVHDVKETIAMRAVIQAIVAQEGATDLS